MISQPLGIKFPVHAGHARLSKDQTHREFLMVDKILLSSDHFGIVLGFAGKFGIDDLKKTDCRNVE